MHQRVLGGVQWVALISATWLRSFKFRSSWPEINDRSCRELQVQVAQVSQGLAEGVRVDSTTMFWTARRYLTARDDELRSRYGRLPAGGRGADGYGYTGEAKRIFPRYNLVEAVLIEVERLDQDQLPDVDTVAETLLAAAEDAQSAFTTPPHDVIEAQAIDEERRLFALNVQRWKGDPVLQADPKPYRRVLAPDESSLWRAEFAYASHEGTVAFGGVLADTLVTTWPEISDWQWHGWPKPTRR